MNHDGDSHDHGRPREIFLPSGPCGAGCAASDSSGPGTSVPGGAGEALRDYIDQQQKERPRRHVMASFVTSLDEFDSLYRELAK